MLMGLAFHHIYIYIYCIYIYVPSNFAIVLSYLPSMLLQRNNSEFRGANKQKSVIPCALIVYSLHFGGGGQPFLNWLTGSNMII